MVQYVEQCNTLFNSFILQIPKPEYLNTIVFSTLKSSKPLGVMLTHANLVSAHSGSVGICENVVSNFLDMYTTIKN